MATLEKIRSKSVLLFVIIIVALLAFILGDFLTSGRTYFGSGTTVAKAGDAKVDYNDYQARMNQLSEANRNQNQDGDEMAQEVIATLLTEKMLQQEYEALGITVTDDELSQALTGKNLHPLAFQFVAQMSQQLGLAEPNGATVFDAIKNPAKYNLQPEAGKQLTQYWSALEKDVEKAMLADKFNSLVLGLYTANNLDAKNLYSTTGTRHVAYVAKPLAAIEDKDVKITDEDRKAAWDRNKGYYMIKEPINTFDYIYVPIEPSAADRAAGAEDVAAAVAALNAAEGTEAVSSDSRFVVNRGSTTKAAIQNASLKAFVDSAAVGSAMVVSNIGDTYTIAKLLGVTNEIDSINISLIGHADGADAADLLAKVNEGASFKSLIDGKDVQGVDSVWQPLIGVTRQDIVEKFTNTPVGQTFILNDTVEGNPVSTLYRINKRHNPVPVYDIAVADFTIDPSQATIAQLSQDLNTFVSANSSADDFIKNATEAGYVVMHGAAGASSPHIGNLKDSRSVVKWVMNAKKGQVMPVFQDNKQTYLLTLAVTDKYEGDYLPWNAAIIAERIDADATRAKKAQMLRERYAGKAKDIAGYAKVMETTPEEADVIFGSRMFGNIYGESALQGAVDAAALNTVVGPIEGNNAVYVFQVTGEAKPTREYSDAAFRQQFNQGFNLGNPRTMQIGQEFLYRMLLGKNKLENNSLKFVNGFGE